MRGQYQWRSTLAAAFPEPSTDALAERFSTQALDLRLPLSPANLRKARASYLRVMRAAGEAQVMSLAEIKDKCQRVRAECAVGRRPSRDDRMLLMAMLRECVRRTIGIQPYNTQMMVLLSLLTKPAELRGRIAQMKTGEGKSTIVAMLAAYLAITNHRVDVISSARPLAVRDEDKYHGFFDALGVETSHICTNRPCKAEPEASRRRLRALLGRPA